MGTSFYKLFTIPEMQRSCHTKCAGFVRDGQRRSLNGK